MAKIRKIWIALLSALLSGLGFVSCTKPEPPMYGPFDGPGSFTYMYGPGPGFTTMYGPPPSSKAVAGTKASDQKACEAILPEKEIEKDNGTDKAAE